MKEYYEWKARANNRIIGQVLRCENGIDRKKTVNKSLNRTVYIQTIGDGLPYADITLLCNVTERDYVNTAEATGQIVIVYYRDKSYSGYFEEEPSWETLEPGMWYQTDLRLLIEYEERV